MNGNKTVAIQAEEREDILKKINENENDIKRIRKSIKTINIKVGLKRMV